MKPLTKDEIAHILERTPRPDGICFIWPSEKQTGIQLKYDTSMFKRGNSFENDVVEFLARISLTHTIIDIDENMNNGRTHSEFVVWTKPSFDTNIDSDVIDAILKNIGGK